jgi:Uma2 family endonuclease
MSLATLPRTVSPVDYPESDGEPMAETDLHVEEIAALLEMLKDRYRDAPDVYVAGNNFVYYEEGNPEARFSPDVYVVFGVPKRPRRTYRLWVEKRAPAFVLEVSSRKTWLEDEGNKKAIYARLGVTEYFLYDLGRDYLDPPLQGFRLDKRVYVPIPAEDQPAVLSQTLGLKFLLENGQLQVIDPTSGERLLRPREAYVALRHEETARRDAEARAAAAEETARRDAELARLRAELERLRGSSSI